MNWNDRFKTAGVTAVIGCGADPRPSNVLCRAAADRLDALDAVNLYGAAELVGPESPVLVPPYSVSTVLAEYARPSVQFLDGLMSSARPCRGRSGSTCPRPGACASSPGSSTCRAASTRRAPSA
jgi:lysine 6-dehydrogenase